MLNQLNDFAMHLHKNEILYPKKTCISIKKYIFVLSKYHMGYCMPERRNIRVHFIQSA